MQQNEPSPIYTLHYSTNTLVIILRDEASKVSVATRKDEIKHTSGPPCISLLFASRRVNYSLSAE